jgi:hypothetical protein
MCVVRIVRYMVGCCVGPKRPWSRPIGAMLTRLERWQLQRHGGWPCSCFQLQPKALLEALDTKDLIKFFGCSWNFVWTGRIMCQCHRQLMTEMRFRWIRAMPNYLPTFVREREKLLGILLVWYFFLIILDLQRFLQLKNIWNVRTLGQFSRLPVTPPPAGRPVLKGSSQKGRLIQLGKKDNL